MECLKKWDSLAKKSCPVASREKLSTQKRPYLPHFSYFLGWNNFWINHTVNRCRFQRNTLFSETPCNIWCYLTKQLSVTGNISIPVQFGRPMTLSCNGNKVNITQKLWTFGHGWKLFHRHLGSVFSSLLLPKNPGYSLLALSSRMAGYGKITIRWSYRVFF